MRYLFFHGLCQANRLDPVIGRRGPVGPSIVNSTRQPRSRLGVILLLAQLPLQLLSGCSGKSPQVIEVEQKILTDLTQQVGKTVKAVVCPESLRTTTDKQVECIGELESGKGFAIAVQQPDPKGEFKWDFPSIRGIVNLEQLKTEIQTSLKADVGEGSLDCGPGKYRAAKPGESFDCQFTLTKPAAKTTLKVPGNSGKSGDAAADQATDKTAAQATDKTSEAKDSQHPDAKDVASKDAVSKDAKAPTPEGNKTAETQGDKPSDANPQKAGESAVQSDPAQPSPAADGKVDSAANKSPDKSPDKSSNHAIAAKTEPSHKPSEKSVSGSPPQPPQKILISLDNAGNISWQPLLPKPVGAEKSASSDKQDPAATKSSAATSSTATSSTTANAPGASPPGTSADKAAESTDKAPAAGNADDFLNQPGATENFD